MTKKVEKNGSGLGEISTIRDILVGGQMKEIEQRLLVMQNQIEESETRLTSQMEKMQDDFSQQFSSIEDALKRHVEELTTRISRSSDQERIKLGQLLADLSNELLNSK